jgi:hypothetical protein
LKLKYWMHKQLHPVAPSASDICIDFVASWPRKSITNQERISWNQLAFQFSPSRTVSRLFLCWKQQSSWPLVISII